jgi:sugar transferase (PEP-CTERM system associated)
MKVFGHYLYPPILLLVVVEFALATLSFVVSAWIMPDATSAAGLQPHAVLLWALGFAVAVIVGFTAVGLYQAKQRLRIEGIVARVFVGLGIGATCVALVDLFFLADISGRLWFLSLALSLVSLTCARVSLWRWVDHSAFRRQVLVYGAGQRAAALLRLRRSSDRRGFNIVAFVPAEGDACVIEDDRVVRIDQALLEFAREHEVDEIVVAMDDRRRGFPIADLMQCKFGGIAVVDLLFFLERETGKVMVDLMNPSWLIFSEGMEGRTRTQVATRMLDLVAAISLLVVALPVMILVAIAVLADDGFPLLYRQERVGLNGRVFTLYKFRSMIKNAEADGKAQWANAKDSRVTRLGGILRKLRLDELPQIFNVLRGDMSLVGPRPERPQFVEQLSKTIPYYHERHVVKPGITGWAQVCYPYGSSERDALEKLQFDLYYIKHKTLIFDLIVLLQTAEVVLWGKGAR